MATFRRRWCSVILQAFPVAGLVLLVAALTYYVLLRHPWDSAWGFVTCLVDTQIVLNWLQFLRFRAIVTPAVKGTFPGYLHRYPSMSSKTPAKDAFEAISDFDRVRRSWKDCNDCDLHVPIQSDHCSLCRRCIFQADQHCYFLGACVGSTNRSFFLILCLYVALGSGVGVANMVDLMSLHRDFTSWDILYYLLPYSCMMLVLHGSVTLLELLYVSLINFGIAAFFVASVLFFSGIMNILCKGGLDQFRQVFGICGWMHFIVPVVPFNGATVLPGYRRVAAFDSIFSTKTDDHLGHV